MKETFRMDEVFLQHLYQFGVVIMLKFVKLSGRGELFMEFFGWMLCTRMAFAEVGRWKSFAICFS
jgi:hypothetical protein